MPIGRPETPSCRTAIIQAMRYHYHLPVTHIARILSIPPQTVSSLTVGIDHHVLSWYERKHQAAAIASAGEILLDRGIHPVP